MIKSKLESDYEICKRGLNRISECIFHRNGKEKLEKFLDEHQYPVYNIRDKSNTMGQFLYKLTKEQVLSHRMDYEMFSVYECLALADEKLILQGDIIINKQFEMIASLSDIKGIPNRLAMQNPKYKICIDLMERSDPCIHGLTKMINYIAEHGLIDVCVEFSMFDLEVGVNKENILIWELRNY